MGDDGRATESKTTCRYSLVDATVKNVVCDLPRRYMRSARCLVICAPGHQVKIWTPCNMTRGPSFESSAKGVAIAMHELIHSNGSTQ